MNSFSHLKYFCAIIFVSFFLSSCATSPVSPSSSVKASETHFAALDKIKQYQLSGRIGIQMPDQGYSGQFSWDHQGTNMNEINFFSPIGSKVANIHQTPLLAVLTNDKGEHFESSSASSLILEHLGWQIPVQDLSDWLLARPNTCLAEQYLAYDEQGRLINMSIQGWRIEYSQYQAYQGIDLPGKVTLRKQDLFLKLIIKHWEVSQ